MSNPTNNASIEEIEQRIAAERARLESEERRETELTESRLAPLETGDDTKLDEIERAIDESRSAQLRTQERIEILERRLVEAKDREGAAKLDALAAKAERAKRAAETLITGEYARHAAAIRSVLSKVSVLREFVDSANTQLQQHGRPDVGWIEELRTIPASRGPSVTTSTLVPATDNRHPQSARYWELLRESQSQTSREAADKLQAVANAIAPTHVDVESDGAYIPAHHAPCVDREVVLPAIDPMQPAYWDQDSYREVQLDIDPLLSEIDPATRPRKPQKEPTP